MEMNDLMAEVVEAKVDKHQLMVVGVGGAGCNAVANMWRANIAGVSYLACNTDRKSLNQNPVNRKICLGGEGLGAGNEPEAGRAAAKASIEDVRTQIEISGCKMIFIAAGMGGGTGTGAAPIIACLAREMGLLSVGIVTSPMVGEGEKRWKQAMDAINEMEQYVDALLVIDNDDVMTTYNDLPLKDAFRHADDVLATATRCIAEIITRESYLVSVDMADVSTVMRNCGRAHMSVTAAKGENRVEEAIKAALCSPLLGKMQISGAKNILLNISTREERDLKARELTQLLDRIQHYANAGRHIEGLSATNIIWGTNANPDMEEGVLELVIIAAGFEVPPPTPHRTPQVEIMTAADTATTRSDGGSDHADSGKAPLGSPDMGSGLTIDFEPSEYVPDPPKGMAAAAARVWGKLTGQVTQFVDNIFDGGADTAIDDDIPDYE